MGRPALHDHFASMIPSFTGSYSFSGPMGKKTLRKTSMRSTPEVIKFITRDALVVVNLFIKVGLFRSVVTMTYKRELASPISVRLPRETKDTLGRMAEERHMELSPFLVAIVEDWLKMRKEIGEEAMNWRTYLDDSEYKGAMKDLIRDTFLESVINTPNYRDNIKDVVKNVLSEVYDEGGSLLDKRRQAKKTKTAHGSKEI
jgi:hypothetical protein